jgi:hypothetical protein
MLIHNLKWNFTKIKFISFNYKDKYCYYCDEKYTKTLLSESQKYCKMQKMLIKFRKQLFEEQLGGIL